MSQTANHFLQLAYLAEIAVVFNIVYMEIKHKSELLKIVKLAKKIKSRALSPIGLCELKDCCPRENSCGDSDSIKSISNKFRLQHISSIIDDLSDENPEITSEYLDYPAVKRKGVRRWVVMRFNDIVNSKKLNDRKISVLALMATTITLLILTIMDIYIPALSPDAYGWKTVLFIVLAISILIPATFWFLWNWLHKEYQCLMVHLVAAYQHSCKSEIEKVSKDLTPLLVGAAKDIKNKSKTLAASKKTSNKSKKATPKKTPKK